MKNQRRVANFNPRTPCGVRRSSSCGRTRRAGDFNPRTPCGVRLRLNCDICATIYFNPRTPCGVRPHAAIQQLQPSRYFNPRTPCGVRPLSPHQPFSPFVFQSTHPLRGATLPIESRWRPRYISIHAPLAGCDCPNIIYPPSPSNFNPRTPCGVRPLQLRKHGQTAITFQSTHPLRGATPASRSSAGRQPISIHAPLAGCDCRRSTWPRSTTTFQSTHPLRGATRT